MYASHKLTVTFFILVLLLKGFVCVSLKNYLLSYHIDLNLTSSGNYTQYIRTTLSTWVERSCEIFQSYFCVRGMTHIRHLDYKLTMTKKSDNKSNSNFKQICIRQ